MTRFTGSFVVSLLAVALIAATAQAQNAYVNFEGSQTNPVRISPDGTRLFAVNTPDARLSVFDISQPSAPALIAEIPVGIEPVSVNPRTNDEVWVVNQVSDSISIVSVTRRVVTETIYVKDEPSDVVFAGGRAFVTASRSNEVHVFDVITLAHLTTIPVFGENPRSLAVSPDASKVYAAFALSGNRTTLIPSSLAPPPPPPTNPALPPAPHEGLIVDATDPAWTPSHIQFTMPDNDVVEIDTAAMSVTRYFSRIGTVNLGIAVRPTNGDIYVGNTEARNLVRFEPNLRGHFVDNRVTRISQLSGVATAFDLNPTIDYTVLPNLSAKSIALAQPTAMLFEPGGNFLYVAAFGTDRVARINITNASVAARIEVGSASGSLVDPRNKRGPRGLALNAATNRLYVLNRISNTISVINTSADAVVTEVPVGNFDPTPPVIKSGRGFLYDAKLSGNGSASCAACHIDSDMDLLAWDLGNPGGQMQTVTSGGQTFQMHPMKGPMTTQTLRGLNTIEPFHWRGDRADFIAFNPAFDSLMGGAQLATADMEAYRDFINTIQFQPNPNQRLDRTLPTSLPGVVGDPVAGQNTFVNETYTNTLSCNTCHSATPGPGTNKLILSAQLLRENQDFKVPHLRNMYQKVNFNNSSGAMSRSGFGFLHDGSFSTLFAFLSQAVFNRFADDTVRKNNIAAFLLCFDTGTAPSVGYTRTLVAASAEAAISDWNLLQGQAAAGNSDLIIKGTIDGQLRGLLFRPPTNDYVTDKMGVGPFTQEQLKNRVLAGDTLTLMGVPPGAGRRMGVDRDADGLFDGDDPAPTIPNQSPATVMHVADIITTNASGSVQTTFTRGQTVFWRVKVVDQNNAPVGGASVTTRLLSPSGVVLNTLTGITGADGWALFSATTNNKSARGTYTVQVQTVTKNNATYDPSANVKTSTTFVLQ